MKVIEKYEDLEDVKKHISDDVDEKELQTVSCFYKVEQIWSGSKSIALKCLIPGAKNNLHFGISLHQKN